ncbi:CPBP family intramembrane glutamic endopeptidase [Citricoccus sp. GCM10030269]|uniref:CPBP family intramembrane glutamic endopeptidase n=1 Tax=Citricoccus sp. GCM10030269 TaxID=3273388 RepID=UPI003610B7CA
MTMSHAVSRTDPHTRPSGSPHQLAHEMPYHRLARRPPRYRWWRPLLALVTTAGVWAAMVLALMVVLGIAAVVDPGLGVAVDEALAPDAPMDLHQPVTALLALGMIAIALPAVLIGVRVGGWRAGLVSSVAGRFRWRLLVRCLAVAAALYATVQGVGLFVEQPEGLADDIPGLAGEGLWMLVMVVLVVPLQATAEEFLFRGLLMQSIGAWLRHPAWTILLPVPLFMIGHEYSWIGQIDIFVFAVAMGWLTWRTGGLEAAIGLHIVGNTFAFAAGAFGLADLNATEINPWAVAISVFVTLLYCAIVGQARRWWAADGAPSLDDPQTTDE